jgi:hypothetical protein
MKLTRLAALTTVVVVAFSGLVAGPAEAAASRPGVVVDFAYHKIKVKPKTIQPFKDLYFSKLRWTTLTKSTGRATGVQNMNTCVPDCSAAHYKRTKVKLKFTRVRLSDCRKVFTRVRVTEVKSHRVRTYHRPVHRRSDCR